MSYRILQSANKLLMWLFFYCFLFLFILFFFYELTSPHKKYKIMMSVPWLCTLVKLKIVPEHICKVATWRIAKSELTLPVLICLPFLS